MSSNIPNNEEPVAHPYKDTAYQTSVEKSGRAEGSYNTYQVTKEGEPDVAQNQVMKNTYQQMSDAALQAQQKYEDALNNYANRVAPENPYNNTLIELADGTKGYVNNLGYFQPMFHDIAKTAGKNMCPPKDDLLPTQLTFDDMSPTSVMQNSEEKYSDTTCNFEGRNIFVTGTVKGANVEPIGAYATSNSLTPYKDSSIGDKLNVFSYEDCKYVAAHKGKSVFGLNNYDYKTGYSQCMLGDNETAATSTKKTEKEIVPKLIYNSAGKWIPKQDPNDVLNWKLLFVGAHTRGSYTKKMLIPFTNDVVGDVGVNGYARGWRDTFVVTQRNVGDNTEITIRRTDGGNPGGWGMNLVLPMFPTDGGNAQRGIEFLKTAEGIDRLRRVSRPFIDRVGRVRGYITVGEHCNNAGWNYRIDVGQEIPDMSRARIKTMQNRPTTRNVNTASFVTNFDGNVAVKVYSGTNYRGYMGIIDGPKRQNLCARIPNTINLSNGRRARFGWNDRIRSMKVVNKGGDPLKLYISGSEPIPPADFARTPIKSMGLDDNGRLSFWSNTHKNGKKLMIWPPPGDFVPKPTIISFVLVYTDNKFYEEAGYGEILKDIPPGFNLITWRYFPQFAGKKNIGYTDENGKFTGSFYSYFNVGLTPEQKRMIAKSAPNPANYQKARHREYISMGGDWLSVNDILSSPDGKLIVEVNPEGNGISMMIEETKYPVISDSQGNKTTKTANNTFLYSMDKVGNPDLYGKMGYVDYNGEVIEYDPNDIKAGKGFYADERKRGMKGNDLPGMPLTNVPSFADAKNKCLENPSCFGVAYEPNTKLAYLKDKGIIYKLGELERQSMFVKRRVQPDPTKFNKGCNDPNDVVSTTSLLYGNYPVGTGFMSSDQCDRNRFLQTPSMQALKKDWMDKRESADKFGKDVETSQTTKQSNLSSQIKETGMNTTENEANDPVYHDTSLRKNPTANNPTSAAMNPNSVEGFTLLPGKRNLQPELESPSQRAKTIKFRNIDSIVNDSQLMVDESYLELGVWTLAGITTAIIGGKLITKLSQ